MHPFTKVQQAMLEEEKWTTPSMTYFRPHFMMPALGAGAAAAATRYEEPAGNNWLQQNYDQALDLQQSQRMKPQAHKTIKHEQVDQTRYGFDQVNYSGNQPGSVKKKDDGKRYACDQCSYVASQKGTLARHKQTQHEGIRPQPVRSGKTFDCDLCPYQASQLNSLKRHSMAKHSSAQHACDKCEYMGSTPNNLRLHKNSKHEGIRYPCDICGYQATQTGGLNRHKELKHGVSRVRLNITNVHHSKYENPNCGTVSQRHPQQRQQQQQQRRPAGPKQPLSGFYHFSSVGRPKVKAAHPHFTDQQVSEELSRRWHTLDEMTRAMFEEVADNGGSNYGNRSGGQRNYSVVSTRNYGKRAKKDPNAPKRSLTAFMCFSNATQADVRRENPGFKIGDTAKELGRRWALASTEVRQKFVDIQNKDIERYAKEKHEYHTNQRGRDMSGPSPSYSNGSNFS